MSPRKSVFRALIAALSVLVFITAFSSPAFAAGGKVKRENGDTHGKKFTLPISKVNKTAPGNPSKSPDPVSKGVGTKAKELAKKQIDKKGSSKPTIADAVAAYKAARVSAITTFQSSMKSARDAYQSAISPAVTIHKAAIDDAKRLRQSTLSTTPNGREKKAAEGIYQSAVKTADEALKISTQSALPIYKAAVASAQQAMNTALNAAKLAEGQSLDAVHTPVPAPTPSATPMPTPTH
jgi:hypothetical protein